MTRRWRFLLYAGAGVALLLAIAAVSAVLVLRSDWLHDKVRSQIVEEVERVSGGRAKIGAFHFDWKTQTADLQNFTLHGGEPPGEAPLFHAADVRIRLKIVSALKRNVDIAALTVDRPEFHLIVNPDGSTNLPGSNLRARLMEQALSLRIGHFELRNGVAQVNERRFPLDVRGDRLAAMFDFDSALKRYVGRVFSRQVHITSPEIESVAVLDFDAGLAIEKDRIQVSRARFATPKSWVELTGDIRDLRLPQGDFEANASISIAEAGKYIALPVDRQGQANFRGKLTFLFGGELSYDLAGRVTARDLAWRSRDVRVAGINVAAEVRLTPNELVSPEFTARALGGDFHGRARIERFERFHIEVNAKRLALDELSRLQNVQPLPWSGFASGPLEIAGAMNRTGVEVSSARAQLQIEGSGSNPLTGDVAVAYDGRARTIEVAKASLQTHATRVELSGVPGRTMHASVETGDLNDLTPALLMVDSSAPRDLPVRLSHGVAKIAGEIGGALDNPQFSGRVDLPAFTMAGRAFDRLSAEIDVNRAHINVRSFALDQDAMRLMGSGSSGLENWRPVETSPITASVSIQNADIARILEQNRQAFPATGTASAHLTLQGTYGAPQGEISLQVDRPSLWGEQFDQLRASARLRGNELNVSPADLRLGQTHAQATAVYRRTGAGWDNGVVQFHVTSKAAPLDQIKNIRTLDYGLAGRVTLDATGTADIRNGQFELTTLNGDAVAQGLSLRAARLGSGKMTARMRGATLDIQLTGDLRGAQVRGSGQWELSGDAPGRAEVQFSPVALAVLHDLAYPAGSKTPLPFQGFVEGAVTITGPLRKLDAITAQVTLPHFEMSANPDQKFRAGVRAQDLVVQNVEPLRFQITRSALTIQSAKFAAKDTKIDAAGRIAFNATSPWDVTVRGGVNMAILQLLSSDLLVQGNAVLDATIGGPIRDPEVNGRLELRNASLSLSDLPTGVDSANGVISFDRNRATIQKLTAQVGGGRVAFGGFVGFGGGVLLYRVQATADQVRLRNSTGATGTFNAALNLTGSSGNALVSGNVTVLRAGFAPGTDLGGLLAASARPLPAPASPNEYLRTINFDVRIESGPSLEFETALTHDIEAEAELRLRGNAARPVLLGNISVTAGDIVVYGNKYEINRGDIRFLNPVRIEPTIDIDLQTKARGITVGLSFTGTLSRLNLTYRSDPPLQTSDIVALLAVGRDPMTSAGLANTQASQSNLFTAEANTITQAISAPSSNRLQRFFGVSRLKIDPQMLGVENTPQARLSVEQQVSRNITVTYVTTLSFTQEQIFRVEWDLNKQWSAVATREENGIFGIDFVYKKRFR